jgi:hypothetical protein
MANTNQGVPLATRSPTPDNIHVLTNVLSLATDFSTCVETFSLIHPSKDGDRDQKIALARIGLQQGRLLIFGDAVGISAPPATIARHMIPSHPGATNPDPSVPVSFGIRDLRLDEPITNQKVRAALEAIAYRPTHMPRDELMEKFGLKTPKRFTVNAYPAIDTNRLEAFREGYSLLLDLVREKGINASFRRGMSMTSQQWTLQNVSRFDELVRTIRNEVDGLVAHLGLKDQIDRGMRTDIRAMGWHPELSGPLVRHDWEKLKLIREACALDYPEYIDAADTALNYISEESRGTAFANMRTAHSTETSSTLQSKTEPNERQTNETKEDKEKRPGLLSHFKFKDRSKGRNKNSSIQAKNIPGPAQQTPPRAMSKSAGRTSDEFNTLKTMRSKSLSHVLDEPAPFNPFAQLESIPTQDDSTASQSESIHNPNNVDSLTHVDTTHSFIERHDMFKGVGRVDTRDIRAQVHDLA